MTIWDASIKLYAWFAERDSFCLELDEKKFFEGAKRKKLERKEELAAIKCALEELKALDMVKNSTVEEHEIWILKKSFDSLPQTVSLSPETCLSISVVVNAFCEMLENTADKVDPKSVEEKDIKNLLFLCSYLMDEKGMSYPNISDEKETE